MVEIKKGRHPLICHAMDKFTPFAMGMHNGQKTMETSLGGSFPYHWNVDIFHPQIFDDLGF
jgi:hypothetical protein